MSNIIKKHELKLDDIKLRRQDRESEMQKLKLRNAEINEGFNKLIRQQTYQEIKKQEELQDMKKQISELKEQLSNSKKEEIEKN